jgi:predicted RNA-binding protein (TIGR00451 family)
MKKWVVSKRDSAELVKKMEESLRVGLGLSRAAQASCVEPEEGTVFIHFGDKVFLKTGERYLPFLGSQPALALFPSASVDEGAIKFVLNGADVMRPGVRSYDDWGETGRLVVVKEEKKGRAIAMGEAQVESRAMETMSKGPCFKNLHRIGDRFWNLYKTV